MKNITCQAAITDGRGNFKIDTINVDKPQKDEVLVKLKAAGICHTDYDSLSWGTPLVMGHEGAGVIANIGEDVNDLSVEDEVILNWATPCGECFQCLNGNYHLCEKNSSVAADKDGVNPGHAHFSGTTHNGKSIERSFNIGTLSEYTLVKSSAVVKKSSKDMPYTTASIISCGVMTGFGSVVNAAKVNPGSSVVVLGAGGIGVNVIQAAKLSGASKIIAVDINSEKLEASKRFGATNQILVDKNDEGLIQSSKKVEVLTDNRGADYAFECTAIPELGAAPLAMIRNAGTAIQVSGIEQEINFDMNLFEWDKTYINPLYGQCNPKIDFPKIMNLYEDNALLLDEMVTREYSLSQLKSAFSDMLSGKNIKGVINFE